MARAAIAAARMIPLGQRVGAIVIDKAWRAVSTDCEELISHFLRECETCNHEARS